MKKSVKILIIVLILIIVGLATFIVVDKVINKNNSEVSKNEIVIANEESGNTEENKNTEENAVENEVEINNVVNNTNTTSNNTTKNNTTNESTTNAVEDFNEKDLEIMGIKLYEGGQGVSHVLGELKSTNRYYTEEATGNNIAELSYDSIGLIATVASNENDPDGSVIEISYNGDKEVTRGLKVSSSYKEVINAFKKESILKEENRDSTTKIITVGYPDADPVYDDGKGKLIFTIDTTTNKVTNICVWAGYAN